MANIPTAVWVSRERLDELRNVLGELSADAEQWHARVVEQAHEEIIGHEPAELADFLLDVTTGLDDWRHYLGTLLGHGTDV